MKPEDLLWLERAEPGWEPAVPPFLALEDNFVSGGDASRRLMVRYYQSPDGTVWAKILSGDLAQGPPGHVHGGGQAALMDESMGGAAWLSGYPVVAANLDITFTRMLPIGEPALIRAEITSVEGRKVHTRAVLTDPAGEREFSRGKGLFITLEKEHLAKLPRAAADIVAQAARRRS